MLRHSRQRGNQIYQEQLKWCMSTNAPLLALYMPGTSNSNQYIDVIQDFHVFFVSFIISHGHKTLSNEV